MRLARRALFAALATLILLSAVTAQTLRPGNDPRNQAPTVGTGGTPGGPTGLFTIYDGDTLRKGEFTFSIAYSNYDRDPGNVDFSVIPLSFNVGLSDHVELFFSTEGYRGVKVNNPKNLSSFYLPNSQLFFGATLLGSGPAIIIAPDRVSGTTGISGAVFRPAFNQPFVQFPFVGGPGPNFGLTGNRIAPPFTSRLGVPTGAEQGNFTAASNFPGVGSPCGSILPGVVLTTRTIPPNSTFNTLTVPDLFTICPTYVADAPFINRLYGESTFGTMQAGAKVRLTGPNNPLGVGFVAFYRWYLDKADDLSGFNQLQRGASPGGDIGDFGLVGFVSGRLSRSVSLSANFGYILNSNPQSEAFGTGKVSLLDRPDELVAGLGMDFVVNKHFQIITELKSIHYTGGRTPNSFQNNPVDFLGGIRIFPRRWFGFSAAYRGHLNQQGRNFIDIFRDEEANDGFPAGFRTSDDPHGFIFQFFAGRRNPPGDHFIYWLKAALPPLPKVVQAARCVAPSSPDPTCTPTSNRVPITADIVYQQAPSRQPENKTDADKSVLLYKWSTTGGRIDGTGQNVTLDLADVAPGTYTITVEVEDGCGCLERAETTVTVEECPCKKGCPNVAVYCSGPVNEGDPLTFTATVDGAAPGANALDWKVTAQPDTGGEERSLRYSDSKEPDTFYDGETPGTIVVQTGGLGGQRVTATATLKGQPDCPWAPPSSCDVTRLPTIYCRAFDAYEDISFNNEKARLDLFAIRLKEDQQSKGYYVTYGGSGRGMDSVNAAERAERARNYLYDQRGIDKSRVVIVDGGPASDCFKVILWVCPSGAGTPPTDLGNEQVKEALRAFGVQCPAEGSYTPPRRIPQKRVKKRHVRRQGGGS